MRPPRMLTTALALLVSLTALTGCGSTPPPAEGVVSPDVTAPVLTFRAETVDGRPFDGATLAGRPAVLWFWTPWCHICEAEAPGLAAAAARHRDRVGFAGVAAQDQVPAMRAFAERTGIAGLPNIADLDGEVWGRFRVLAQPTFVFIDKSGNQKRTQGILTPGELDAEIAAIS